ncbi:hypothetical protein [Streptosporangium sp. NPDC051022]|uniref:hypothetical protein n=1 Tax=Streptosporangium sp. NPDC051022 TaxID=3155752 RepID=UPI003437FD16
MTKHLDVGRSWRTWAKHELMSSFVGQEVGAAGRLRAVERLGWIDLSAGDAAPVDGVEWRKACSPGILAYHAACSAKPVEVVLYEIQPATYDRLLSNLTAQLPWMGYVQHSYNLWRLGDRVRVRVLNASGHTASVGFIERTDAILALNDPNAMTEWAMRDSFAQEIVDRTGWFRSLSTMGCNPAGLKRLDLEERQAWFGLVGAQQDALPDYRDLLLAAIERDDAQWAYLLSTAAKWRGSTESVVRTAFKRIGRTAAMAWLGQDPHQFEETKRALFLTKKELREQASTPLPLWEAS